MKLKSSIQFHTELDLPIAAGFMLLFEQLKDALGGRVWFHLANGQKVRLYRAGGKRVVLLPSKDDVGAVLY